MKMHITFIGTFTALFLVVGQSSAIDETSQKAGADIVIQEPSGAEPNAPTDYRPVPVDATARTNATEVSSTVTISHTVTNSANTITIVGVVDSENQKQSVAARLQEILPGKNINNFLVVSNASQNAGIVEPAGAEKSADQSKGNESEKSGQIKPK
jgi:hypothetical protein